MITEENILIEAGLSEEQALIYNALLEKGPQKASVLATWTGIKRSLVYKVLEQLEGMLLVSKKGGSGSVAVFFPEHPSQILRFIEQKEKAIVLSKETVAVSLGAFVSKYNLLSDKPNIQFYEGKKGIQSLYANILATHKDIFLIQSPHDRERPEIGDLISEQIKKQVQLGIKTKAITPLVDDTKLFVEQYDAKNLVERRVIKKEDFSPPAQIIIFGNKIGVTSFDENMITTIIENEAIAKTFTTMFNFIWKKQEKEHNEIIQSFGISLDNEEKNSL